MSSVSLNPQIQDACTVISIMPIPINEKKPGLIPGEFSIKAVKNIKTEIEVLIVSRSKFPVYIDENRPALVIPEPSDRVAASIVRDFKVSLSHYEPNVAEPGLFFVQGGWSIKSAYNQFIDEIELARKLQTVWFERIVDAADDDWMKYHMRKMISHVQRVACTELGLKKEWNQAREVEEYLKMKQCKFCRADVHPEAIVCQHCQGVLDLARYDREYTKAGTAVKA